MAAANTSRSPSTSPNRTNTYASDPSLYLYTSLTAGSSHIITATSRLETILKGNKLDFKAIDIATDERARTLWSRRARGKKLPGLVKYGTVIGNIDEVDEWNEEEILLDRIENVPGRIEPELEKPKADNKTATAASSATSPKETETAAKAKPTETSKETKEMGDDEFQELIDAAAASNPSPDVIEAMLKETERRKSIASLKDVENKSKNDATPTPSRTPSTTSKRRIQIEDPISRSASLNKSTSRAQKKGDASKTKAESNKSETGKNVALDTPVVASPPGEAEEEVDEEQLAHERALHAQKLQQASEEAARKARENTRARLGLHPASQGTEKSGIASASTNPTGGAQTKEGTAQSTDTKEQSEEKELKATQEPSKPVEPEEETPKTEETTTEEQSKAKDGPANQPATQEEPVEKHEPEPTQAQKGTDDKPEAADRPANDIQQAESHEAEPQTTHEPPLASHLQEEQLSSPAQEQEEQEQMNVGESKKEEGTEQPSAAEVKPVQEPEVKEAVDKELPSDAPHSPIQLQTEAANAEETRNTPLEEEKPVDTVIEQEKDEKKDEDKDTPVESQQPVGAVEIQDDEEKREVTKEPSSAPEKEEKEEAKHEATPALENKEEKEEATKEPSPAPEKIKEKEVIDGPSPAAEMSKPEEQVTSKIEPEKKKAEAPGPNVAAAPESAAPAEESPEDFSDYLAARAILDSQVEAATPERTAATEAGEVKEAAPAAQEMPSQPQPPPEPQPIDRSPEKKESPKEKEFGYQGGNRRPSGVLDNRQSPLGDYGTANRDIASELFSSSNLDLNFTFDKSSDQPTTRSLSGLQSTPYNNAQRPSTTGEEADVAGEKESENSPSRTSSSEHKRRSFLFSRHKHTRTNSGGPSGFSGGETRAAKRRAKEEQQQESKPKGSEDTTSTPITSKAADSAAAASSTSSDVGPSKSQQQTLSQRRSQEKTNNAAAQGDLPTFTNGDPSSIPFSDSNDLDLSLKLPRSDPAPALVVPEEPAGRSSLSPRKSGERRASAARSLGDAKKEKGGKGAAGDKEKKKHMCFCM